MLGQYRGGSPLSKRPRMDDGFGRPVKNEPDDRMNVGDRGGGVRSGILPMMGGGGGGGGGDFGNSAMPSRVLQVRNLPENAVEADLLDALSHFGPVSYVSMAGRGMALVEFEDIPSAERCVAHNRNTDIMVLNTPAWFSYANMPLIPRQGLESERPSNVLIFYVQNPKYPITPDIVHAIVKPIGRVNRIIVNRTSGIQALVEMVDIDSARIIKQRLNGCDIYSGCCTLKIEYAKMSRLNIVPNNVDHADYAAGTNGNPLGFDEMGRPIYGDSAGATGGGSGMDVKPMQGGGLGAPAFSTGMVSGRGGIGLMDDYQSAAQAQIAALSASGGSSSQPAFVGGAQPPFGAIGSQLMMGAGAGGNSGGYMGGVRDQGQSIRQFQDSSAPYQSNFMGERGPMNEHSTQKMPDGCGLDEDGAVLMVYGMDPEHVNCDKLFNLFCLYGNVMRIKFLKSKNDTVMVQMGDSLAAQRAMENLRNCIIFGKPMHMAISRQSQLKAVRGDAVELPDKSSSYRDYSNVRLNRFVTPEIAAKNRINPPQKFIYFFNAPPGIDKDRIAKVIDDNCAPKPVDIQLFPQRGAGVPKNSAGIIEYEDETKAVEGLMLCNHALMEHEGSSSPFVLKLCFAGPAHTSAGGGGRGYGPSGGDRGFGGGFGGRGDRDRDRDREFGGGRGERFSDRGDGGRRYNGPGGPREDRGRRGGSRERDRERDRDGGGRGEFRGRGRGRGGGRGGR